MTQPPRKRMTPEEYALARQNNWTDDELRAGGYEPPGAGPTLPSAAPVDRLDQTIRNPEGRDPMLRAAGVAARVAPFAVGMGTGGGVAALGMRALAKYPLTAMGRMAGGAAVGAVAGSAGRGAQAAVSGDNPIPDMVPRASDAAIGGLFTGVGDLAGRALDRYRAFRATRNPLQRAPAEIGKVLHTGKVDLAKAAASAPDDARVVDILGPDGLDLAKTAMQSPSVARTELAEKLAGRALGRDERIRGALTEATGVPENLNPFAVSQQIDETLKPSIDHGYRLARQAGKRLKDQELTDMLFGREATPHMQAAVAHARKVFRNTKKALPKQPLLKEWPEGGGTDIPNLEFADRAKRFLDAKARTAIAKEEYAELMEINVSRNALVSKLDQLVPQYKEARAGEHARRMFQEALHMGRSVARGNKDPREVQRALDALIPEGAATEVAATAREYFRRGVVDGIRRNMDKGADGTVAMKRLAGTSWRQEVADLAIPGQPQKQAFREAMESEAALMPAEAVARSRGAAHAMDATDSYGPATPWAMSQLFGGNPQLFAAQYTGQVLRDAQQKTFQKSAEQIVRELGLVAKRGGKVTPEVQELIARIRASSGVPADRAAIARRAATAAGAIAGARRRD